MGCRKKDLGMLVLGTVFLLMVGSLGLMMALADVEDRSVYPCVLFACLPFTIGGGLMVLHGLRPPKRPGDPKGPARF